MFGARSLELLPEAATRWSWRGVLPVSFGLLLVLPGLLPAFPDLLPAFPGLLLVLPVSRSRWTCLPQAAVIQFSLIHSDRANTKPASVGSIAEPRAYQTRSSSLELAIQRLAAQSLARARLMLTRENTSQQTNPALLSCNSSQLFPAVSGAELPTSDCP